MTVKDYIHTIIYTIISEFSTCFHIFTLFPTRPNGCFANQQETTRFPTLSFVSTSTLRLPRASARPKRFFAFPSLTARFRLFRRHPTRINAYLLTSRLTLVSTRFHFSPRITTGPNELPPVFQLYLLFSPVPPTLSHLGKTFARCNVLQRVFWRFCAFPGVTTRSNSLPQVFMLFIALS